MTKNKFYHGDVILTPISESNIPAGAREVPRDADQKVVLRRGEHSGHAHVITDETDEAVKLFAFGSGLEQEFFLHVELPVTVTHEEHHVGTIVPGFYKVGAAREEDPFTGIASPVYD